MEYRSLGATGMKVTPYCLGTMMFGAIGNPDHEDSIRIIHRALDAGINFVDTADAYSNGECEEIVGKALKGRRDDLVLATKVHMPMSSDPNHRGNSRRWIIREVEASLRRLQTDHIDLYQIHRPDPATGIEETLSALSDLIHQGKVRAIGSSTFQAHQIVEAQWAAERHNLERFTCEQPPYSIFVREIERAVLPVCQDYKMGVIVWSPLAGGWLGGRYRRPEDVDISTGRAGRLPARFSLERPGNRAKLELVEGLEAVAKRAGLTLAGLAIGFTLSHPGVTSTIIGPRTMEHLESLLEVESVRLSNEVLDEIDDLVAPGTNLNRDDWGYTPPSLADSATRRRADLPG